MPTTLIRIDPALPICWQDPDTLRIGFDRAEVSIASPSPVLQRLLSALVTGVRSDRLSRTLARVGASTAEWSHLTDMLEDALLVTDGAPDAPAHASETPRIGVGVIAPRGRSPVTAVLLDAFDRAGFEAGLFSSGDRRYGLVVSVERFLEPCGPERLDAAGLPQLSIRFSDRSTAVGPLVEGEGRPCLGCVTLHDIDADPALPALAAQLLGKTPAAETVASTEIAAALAVSLVRQWLAGSELPGRTRLRVPVREGLPSPEFERERVESHPECGCALTAATTGRTPR